jgi:DNA polymerase-3 subunit delta'
MAKNEDFDIPPPRENPLLIGHALVEQRFIEEFTGGKPHHAYLMTGPKGIGKATLAYRLARYILSQGAHSAEQEAPSMSLFGDPEPAPAASAQSLAMDADNPLFRRVASGSHTDLLTLSPGYDEKKKVEKNLIPVDEARKVPEFMSLTPAEGLWRIVIIDAVDQLNNQAANALLKILEEPPSRAILFLVCHQPGAILPTIRSRCRLLKLTAPDADAFAEILSTIAPQIESHEYAALYGLAHGSPGQAITLYQEQGLKWYEGWLNAMTPGASGDTRQKFADSASFVKSPAGWAAIIHGWRTALERISLYPHYDADRAIFRKEPELIASIAASMNPRQCAEWIEKGNRLIHETETFHLDKRQTLRLLIDPAQLDMMAA